MVTAAPVAADAGPPTAARSAGTETASQLQRRIQRLLPALMSSLAAARREGDPTLIRCFDQAVSALHSLDRQVSYHADRKAQATQSTERARHEKALVFLRERVDELAHSGESCFTEGAWVPPGATYVEVTIAPPKR